MKYVEFVRLLKKLVCPTCFGEGETFCKSNKMRVCPDCDGLGRKPIPEDAPQEIIDVFNEG